MCYSWIRWILKAHVLRFSSHPIAGRSRNFPEVEPTEWVVAVWLVTWGCDTTDSPLSLLPGLEWHARALTVLHTVHHTYTVLLPEASKACPHMIMD